MIISCNDCGAKYNVPDSKAGKSAKCAKCGATMAIVPPSASDEGQTDWMDAPSAPARPVRRSSPAKSSGGTWIVFLIVALVLGVAAMVVIPKLSDEPAATDDQASQTDSRKDQRETLDAQPLAPEVAPTEPEPAPELVVEVPEPAPEPAPAEPVITIAPTPIELQFPPELGFNAYATERYLLYCGAPAEVKADLAMRLEMFYDVYAEIVGDLYSPGDGERAKVFFIPDQGAFIAAGGPEHAPGVFIVPPDPADTVGPRLLIRRGTGFIYLELSQLLQHEAWHQFNQLHLQPYSPIWFDEGMATYISYGIWTGDYVVPGSINHSSRYLLSLSIPHFMPISQLLGLNDWDWRVYQEYVTQNCVAAGIDDMGFWTPYMESWSLIQFLKHANGGAYASLLDDYVADIVAGRDASGSVAAITALENEWYTWVQVLANQPMATGGKFQEAIVATFAGHLARADINGQSIASVDDLIALAEAGQLDLGEMGSDTWLPASVFNESSRYLGFLRQGCEAYGHSAPELTIEIVNGVPGVRMRIDSMDVNLFAIATVEDGQVTGVTVTGLETIPADLR